MCFSRVNANSALICASAWQIRSLFVSFLLFAILTVVAVNIFADIITDNDAEVRLNSRLTYYLTVQEDGVDVDGVESSDTQMSNLTSGRISVTDRISDGLIFQGFITTPNGNLDGDTGNVTDLSYMFAYGYQIASLTVLDDWNTHSVLEKGNMFLNIPDYIERPSWWDL